MNELDNKYQTFIDILNEELVPAMGCTEPIAIAFCAAKVKEVLGNNPSELNIFVSGNILKNVKSVIVPHTHGRHGIEVAAAIGILAGDSNKKLEADKSSASAFLFNYSDTTSVASVSSATSSIPL